MPIWREAGAGQPVYEDKELVTFEVHHGGRIVKNKQIKWCYTGGSVGYLDWYTVEYINMVEMWEQVKLLGHMRKVSLKGVVNDELLDINTDGELLSLCDKVPLSYERMVLIYVQHIEEEGVTVNEDCEEVGVALNEDSEEEGLALNEDSEEEDAALNEDIGLVIDENRAFKGNGPLNNDK
ncbi:hypothetical protein L3X38_041540 [Prunus dulcis]|uniref:PB1-like domain-containing protein n=1 Tax=Prunus dulcis TaxID=3755 RepID=A0AAD4YJB8_PRUDU|nr:hypothetical protein L3X38_041540 [Prunus dulcis]